MERAANAECVNAQVRNRRLQRIPVRGLLKARAVALLHALAHNLARMIALARALVGRADMEAAATVCTAKESNSSQVRAGPRALAGITAPQAPRLGCRSTRPPSARVNRKDQSVLKL